MHCLYPRCDLYTFIFSRHKQSEEGDVGMSPIHPACPFTCPAHVISGASLKNCWIFFFPKNSDNHNMKWCLLIFGYICNFYIFSRLQVGLTLIVVGFFSWRALCYHVWMHIDCWDWPTMMNRFYKTCRQVNSHSFILFLLRHILCRIIYDVLPWKRCPRVLHNNGFLHELGKHDVEAVPDVWGIWFVR